MSVLLIVGQKSMLAASHVSHSEYESRWVCWQDRQTDGRQTVTVCLC